MGKLKKAPWQCDKQWGGRKIKQCQKHWRCIISFLFVLISTYFCRKRLVGVGAHMLVFSLVDQMPLVTVWCKKKSSSSVKAHSISMAYICVNPTFWVWACKTGALGQQILVFICGVYRCGVKQQPARLNISKYPK